MYAQNNLPCAVNNQTNSFLSPKIGYISIPRILFILTIQKKSKHLKMYIVLIFYVNRFHRPIPIISGGASDIQIIYPLAGYPDKL